MRRRSRNWFIAFPVIAGSDIVAKSVDGRPPAILPVAADDLHITVAFLGPVSRRKAYSAWRKLADFSPGSVDITFNQLKPFGPYSKPTAYGLSLAHGRESIHNLISSVRKKVLSSAGKKPHAGRIVPHVTVARPCRRLSRDDFSAISSWRNDYEVPAINIVIDEIALYTRSDKPDAGRFTIIERKSLTG